MAIQDETTGVKEKILERHHHKALRDDDAPQLKVDLDGNKQSIKDLKDVELQSINGKDFEDLLQSIYRSIEDAEKRCATKGHSHPEFEQLKAYVDRSLATLIPKGSFSPADHTHTLGSLSGTLPISRVENGLLLLSLLGRQLADAIHSHPDLENAIADLAQKIEALPEPETFDASPLWAAINGLHAQVLAIKPVQPIVEVQITPVEAPKVTCRCEYLILDKRPENPTVHDASGTEGKVKMTEQGGKCLARAVFAGDPVQPLTFAFTTPPTLCAIGSSTDSSTS